VFITHVAAKERRGIIAVQVAKPPAFLFIVAKLLRGYTDLFHRHNNLERWYPDTVRARSGLSNFLGVLSLQKPSPISKAISTS
jgi:hypothetical protein